MFAEAKEQIREAILGWPKSPAHPLASLRVDLHHCRRQIRDKEMEAGQPNEALLHELRERANLYSKRRINPVGLGLSPSSRSR